MTPPTSLAAAAPERHNEYRGMKSLLDVKLNIYIYFVGCEWSGVVRVGDKRITGNVLLNLRGTARSRPFSGGVAAEKLRHAALLR